MDADSEGPELVDRRRSLVGSVQLQHHVVGAGPDGDGDFVRVCPSGGGGISGWKRWALRLLDEQADLGERVHRAAEPCLGESPEDTGGVLQDCLELDLPASVRSEVLVDAAWANRSRRRARDLLSRRAGSWCASPGKLGHGGPSWRREARSTMHYEKVVEEMKDDAASALRMRFWPR
jgi:hypothetical protein